MKEINEKLSKPVRVVWTGGEAFAQVISTTDSLMHSVTPGRQLHWKLAVGITSGIVEALNCYFFQGAVIERVMSGKELADETIFDALAGNKPIPIRQPEVSTTRKVVDAVLSDGYFVVSPLMEVMKLLFLASVLEAWISGLRGDNKSELLNLSPVVLIGVLAYFLLVVFPYIAFGANYQTIKGARKLLKVPHEQAYDWKIACKLHNAIQPIVSSELIRRYVQIIGSAGDTLKHVIPFLVILEPEWILFIAQKALSISIPVFILAGLLFIISAATIYLESYLFEGEYCKKTMESLVHGSSVDPDLETHERYIPEFFSKIFDKLLRFPGGFLHGVDTALTLSIFLRQQKTKLALTISLTLLQLLIAWYGADRSGIKESRERLWKKTKISDVVIKFKSPVFGFEWEKNSANPERIAKEEDPLNRELMYIDYQTSSSQVDVRPALAPSMG